MSNTITTTPQDLQEKFERYRNIQREKINDRDRMTKLVSNVAMLCTIALFGMAAATRGSAQTNLATGAVGSFAVAMGAQVVRKIGNKRTRNEMLRVRQTFLMDDNRA
ncbi:MAG: hypothetical protein II942_04755 [Alphaproteobacteria bacterium]|nr:hypothetical protein [Alphaproteobacteria bacterium]